jgi:OFA family oxalate/formate antiporter-like MFS transporter
METTPQKSSIHQVVTVIFAAILIQLALGSVYGWSVFTNPLQKTCQWTKPQVTLAFSLAICFLGIAACVVGPRADRYPRLIAVVGGAVFGIGNLLAGIAVTYHSLALLYLGYGVLAGSGMGMAYLVPIAVAIKWVPHRRGFIGGLVVMGFGAGAVTVGLAAPAVIARIGPGQTLLGLGLIFTILCPLAGFLVANPPGYTPKPLGSELRLLTVLRRREFWALWGMLFFNVCAGIAIISQASPMAQEMHHLSVRSAGSLVAIIALFNGLGRVFWSGVSDKTGRPFVFLFMYITQIAAFVTLPFAPNIWIFGLLCCYILLCYGGGFGTMPAFTADLFGHESVGRIYGPVLTAWSAAGLLGPLLYAFLREKTGGYSTALFLTAGLLALACGLPSLILNKINKKA